jgi:hypothetical protein
MFAQSRKDKIHSRGENPRPYVVRFPLPTITERWGVVFNISLDARHLMHITYSMYNVTRSLEPEAWSLRRRVACEGHEAGRLSAVSQA